MRDGRAPLSSMWAVFPARVAAAVFLLGYFIALEETDLGKPCWGTGHFCPLLEHPLPFCPPGLFCNSDIFFVNVMACWRRSPSLQALRVPVAGDLASPGSHAFWD